MLECHYVRICGVCRYIMIYDDALKLDYLKRCSEEISSLNVCDYKILHINNID